MIQSCGELDLCKIEFFMNNIDLKIQLVVGHLIIS